MSTVHEPPYPGARAAAYLVFVLFLVWLMAYLDRQVFTLLLPSLKVYFKATDTELSLVQGMGFASVYSVAGLPLGWVADRANRRNLILFGLIVWSLATMACALAGGLWQLGLARMAVAFGEACLAPACVSLMADSFASESRGRAMGLMQAGTPVGSSGALFLGGLLLMAAAHGAFSGTAVSGWAPWKIVFLAFGAPGLAVALLVATLREPARRTPEVAVTSARARPELTRKHYAALALIYAVYSCIFIMGYAVSSWAPTVLMRIYGFAPVQAGATYGAMLLVCSATAGVCSGFVSDALRRRWPLNGRVFIPLFVLPIDIAALCVFALAHTRGPAIAAMAVSTFTMNFSAVSSYPALQDLAPPQLRGRVVAVLILLGSLLGLGCGPTLVALVTDHVLHDEMALRAAVGVVGVSVAALGWCLALFLPAIYSAARRDRLGPVPDHGGGVAAALARGDAA